MIQWENVTYGADVSQRMHIWELNDLAPRDGWGAVVLLHGGGWREGTWEDFLSLGPALARRGLICRGVGLSIGACASLAGPNR